MLFGVKFVRRVFLPTLLSLAALLAVSSPAVAQEIVPCSSIEKPGVVPPKDSPTLYRCAQIVFHPTGESLIEPQTYQYYLKYRISDTEATPPVWVPYKQDSVVADGLNLWKSGFLDNYW